MISRAVWVCIAALAVVSCSKNKATPPIATLTAITAQVERMPDAAASWRAAGVGDEFFLGSAIRTGAASHAQLRLGATGKLDVAPDSVVYFTNHPGQASSDIHVETGAIEVEAGDDAVGFGTAIIEPHAHARVATTAGGLTITASFGRVVVEDGELAVGSSVVLGPDGKRRGSAQPGTTTAKGTITVAVTRGSLPPVAGGEPFAEGAHVVPIGTELDVPEGVTIEVRRDGARATVTGKAHVRIGGPNGALVTASDGSLALYGDSAPAVASVPGGTITAEAGSSETAAAITAEATQIGSRRGTTTIESTTGAKQTLSPGEWAHLVANGDLQRDAKGPERAAFSFAAGESPTIHDPQAPTALGVVFGPTCPGAGKLEVASDAGYRHVVARANGVAGRANVAVSPGTYVYRVRCDAGAGGSGTIHLLRDSGRAPLPKTAAHTMVEADGREYTILYQNLLPELTLLWSKPKNSVKYTFVVSGGGREHRFEEVAPRTTLRAGELGEGTYKMWVEAAEGRSETTRIVIEFDNAAPSASLESVEITADGAKIRGVVIAGSTVSSAGTPIELDRHNRFTAQLAPADGEDAIAVRIATPKGGVHYYAVRLK